MSKKKLKLTDPRPSYKPFNYQWCYETWMDHERMHWGHWEAPLLEDVKDWNTKLTQSEQNFLTHIFRFFTQGDISVANAYVMNYLPVFPQPEVRMMLLSFAAREATHIAAYSNLVETLGMPDTIYNQFLEYDAMREKYEYVENFIGTDTESIAQQLAVFSAFTEGMQLFSSFIMLLNFPRHGTMVGMGSNISWSILDEKVHADSMIKLFRVFIEENRHIWKDSLKSQLYTIAERMVDLEDKFIDLAFEMGEMKDLTAADVKLYIRYIADRRLIALGLKGIFKIKKNPLPWVEQMIDSVTHGNFFEQKVFEYSKGATEGDWDDVWGQYSGDDAPMFGSADRYVGIPEFTVYSKPGCPQCDQAKALLTNKDKQFITKMLDVDFTRDDFSEKFPSARSFPQIVCPDGTPIGGLPDLHKYLTNLVVN
jgi:ribonucleoside-diphosphate reductase beta chain